MAKARAAFALFLLALPSLALAQPSREALEEARRAGAASRAAAEAAAREAEAAAAEESGLARQRVAMAARVQEAERALEAALHRKQGAEAEAAAAFNEAAARAASLAPMMPAMRRLALWPAETLLAQPAPPDEALRGLLVLQGIARQIRAEVEVLHLVHAEAERRNRIATAEASLVVAAEAELRHAAEALDAEIAETRLRQREARATERAEAQRAQEALARANDLQEMLTALEREQARQAAAAAQRARQEAQARARQEARQPRPATPVATPQPAPPVADQARPAPVHGRISIAFGQRGEAGPARGVTFATAGGARVVSPCTGRAVFAGPFRRFGQIIILECGPGLHLVLAGFEALDTEAGAALLAGEALGRLSAGPDGRGALYLELRRDGQVVDPSPWLGGAE
ncbi:MAG: peptidoglycan DD-metalloendopeptidase family protein [Roseomonas sp.]|nr:peptidoglycan DD-metalloendopeptidase family protein [Roseomonas sp.]MCA3391881.1 peptidoglycan DD-metalloendopeptidase family protein [Roseomonas sp.]MCA3406391.1 peptidoglycan DD-metalloendopeptidase family protein [Roseomonas sp.]